MSRRIREQELEAGSDSFLDIIANIVGILIILIVIAGVKVSRQPLQAAAAKQPAEPESVVAPPATTTDPVPSEPAEPVVALAEPIPPAIVSDGEPDPPTELPPLDTSVVEQLEDRLDRTRADKQRLQVSLAAVNRELEVKSAALDEQIRSVTDARGSLVSLLQETDAQRGEAAKLQRLLDEAEASKVNVTELRHRVTPVGEDVSGREIHFRIADGRIAYVPINELIEDLKSDAARQQRWLLRNPIYRGSVGPVLGFRMKYDLERRRQSLAEELRYGTATFRVAVSQWEIEATRDIESEDVSRALTPGSLFARRLRRTSRDTNITFWVYPDSFDAYRKLQQAVHAEGFRVAGRPLPHGVPIAGSPNGTRSSGQ